MGKLLACPFCRELYTQGECESCPECDLPVVDLAKLPLSHEAQIEDDANAPADPPTDRDLGLLYLKRGRGALAALSALGLASFFTPWASLQRPDRLDLSGADLASAFGPWIFGGAIGFFLLFPLTISRRSVNALRGVRVIAILFSALTLGEALTLYLRPPTGSRFFTYGFAFEWGFWLSAAISLTAIVVASRLGGSATDLRDLPFRLDTDRREGERLN